MLGPSTARMGEKGCPPHLTLDSPRRGARGEERMRNDLFVILGLMLSALQLLVSWRAVEKKDRVRPTFSKNSRHLDSRV